MAFLGTAAAYIGSFFATDAAVGATTAAAATAAEAAVPEIVVTGTAAAGTAGAVGAGVGAAGAGAAAGGAAAAAAASGASGAATPPPPGHRIATTIEEASAIASGASALYSLANGPGRVNVPPSPMTGQGQIDQSVQNAEQQELRRREAAGGLQGTTGTAGGQAGAVLNPATMSSHTLLGG